MIYVGLGLIIGLAVYSIIRGIKQLILNSKLKEMLNTLSYNHDDKHVRYFLEKHGWKQIGSFDPVTGIVVFQKPYGNTYREVYVYSEDIVALDQREDEASFYLCSIFDIMKLLCIEHPEDLEAFQYRMDVAISIDKEMADRENASKVL